MKQVTLVGCGFLGSILLEELCKRAFAFGESLFFSLIDDDEFESRNAANQNVSLADVEEGLYKSKRAWQICKSYNQKALRHQIFLDNGNVDELIQKPVALVIDAVDNLPTRQLLWKQALKLDIPVLHLGISQGGTGKVEWTLGKGFDNFSLSPVALAGRSIKEIQALTEVETLPPCELVAFRGLGLNTALAAAKAVFIYFGFDPEREILNASDGEIGVATSWNASNRGHEISPHETQGV